MHRGSGRWLRKFCSVCPLVAIKLMVKSPCRRTHCVCLSLSLSLSLFLSFALSHTHTLLHMTTHMQTHAVTVSLTWSMAHIHTNTLKHVHTHRGAHALTYTFMWCVTVRVSQRADAVLMYWESSSGNVLSVETHSPYARTHTHTHHRSNRLEGERSEKKTLMRPRWSPLLSSLFFSFFTHSSPSFLPLFPSLCSLSLISLMSYLATGRLPPRG